MERCIVEKYITQIDRIIYTLNQVSVRGMENLDRLLASIQALDEMKGVMKSDMLEEKKHAAENK